MSATVSHPPCLEKLPPLDSAERCPGQDPPPTAVQIHRIQIHPTLPRPHAEPSARAVLVCWSCWGSVGPVLCLGRAVMYRHRLCCRLQVHCQVEQVRMCLWWRCATKIRQYLRSDGLDWFGDCPGRPLSTWVQVWYVTAVRLFLKRPGKTERIAWSSLEEVSVR